MIYTYKDYRLEIDKDKGNFYFKDRLKFKGFAFTALNLFIDNCNDDSIKKRFKAQLGMREKCRFNKEDK